MSEETSGGHPTMGDLKPEASKTLAPIPLKLQLPNGRNVHAANGSSTTSSNDKASSGDLSSNHTAATSLSQTESDTAALTHQYDVVRGYPVTCWTNRLKVSLPGDVFFHRYSVVSNRASTDSGKKHLIKELLDLPRFDGEHRGIITDYDSILLSYRPIQLDNHGPEAMLIMNIKLIEHSVVTLPTLLRYFQNTKQDNKHFQEQLMQALDCVVSERANNGLVSDTRGSRRCNLPTTIASLDSHADYLEGCEPTKSGPFYTIPATMAEHLGIEPVKGRLCVSTRTQGQSNEAITVSEIMSHVLKAKVDDKWTDFDLLTLGQLLKGLKVKVADGFDDDGTTLKHKIRNISGFAKAGDGSGMKPSKVAYYAAGPAGVFFFFQIRGSVSPEDIDANTPGEYVSVQQYFNKRYGATEYKYDWPVVNVGTKKRPVYYPAEQCVVIAGQLAVSEHDEGIKVFQKCPRSARQGGKGPLNASEIGQVAFTSDIHIDWPVVTVDAHRLMAPIMATKPGGEISKTADGTILNCTRFTNTNATSRWSFLRIAADDETTSAKTRRESELNDADAYDGFIAKFMKTAGECGLTLPLPIEPKRFVEDQVTLDRIKRWFQEIATKDVEVMIVLLPTRSKALYSYVKAAGDKYGLQTICIVGKEGAPFTPKSKHLYGLLRNTALKVNLRLGNATHLVEKTEIGILNDGKTMIVGIDVIHADSTAKFDCPSITAMVANINSNLSQWPAATCLQKPNLDQTVTYVGKLFGSRLALWTNNHDGKLPTNILVYRSGLSSNQAATVCDKEYNDMMETYLTLRNNQVNRHTPNTHTFPHPKFTIIAVTKADKCRFYPTTRTNTPDGQNTTATDPGTLVDRGPTDLHQHDFFLQTHAGSQGNARPTHYTILKDEIFAGTTTTTSPGVTVASTALKSLTHTLCYTSPSSSLYATKATSIVPPARYATLACRRSRTRIEASFPELFHPRKEILEDRAARREHARRIALRKGYAGVNGVGYTAPVPEFVPLERKKIWRENVTAAIEDANEENGVMDGEQQSKLQAQAAKKWKGLVEVEGNVHSRLRDTMFYA